MGTAPATFFQNNGCDEFQGYLFHRPSDVDYIENLFIKYTEGNVAKKAGE